jgi:hypothetical protein
MQMIRISMASLCALTAMLVLTLSHSQASTAQSCGETSFLADGVTYRVLFAKNGAVQQYLLADTSPNQERDHDALLAAQQKYGPEAINAPPVRIVSFKPGPGGMMVPDKAMDSCGRLTHFH